MRKLIVIAVATVSIAIVTERCSRDRDRQTARYSELIVVDTAPITTQPVALATPANPVAQASAPAAPVADRREIEALGWMGTDSENEPRALSAQLRREPRDGAWAPYSEQEIRTQISRVSALGEREHLSIACGSTVCEVAGWFPKDSSTANMNTVTEAMQSATLRESLKTARLMSGAQTYDGADGATSFRLYFMKAAN